MNYPAGMYKSQRSAKINAQKYEGQLKQPKQNNVRAALAAEGRCR